MVPGLMQAMVGLEFYAVLKFRSNKLKQNNVFVYKVDFGSQI